MSGAVLTRAEIVAVGSELLALGRTDTNSVHITNRLATYGIDVIAKSIVRDHQGDLVASLCTALARADLIITTGGLGPTDDDRTRAAVAEALCVGLHEDAEQIAWITERFSRRGLETPGINRRQAQILDGAVRLANPNGTAPGQWFERAGQVVVLLPGPPREMIPMFEQVMTTRLASRAGVLRTHRRAVRVAGRSESWVETAMQPLYAEWASWAVPVEATILANFGRIDLYLFVRSASDVAAASVLDEAATMAVGVLGSCVYTTDERLLEEVVGDTLRERGWRVAMAESCTGGMLGWRLTSVPGSSAWVEGGVIAYSNAMKTALAQVPAKLVDEHGAVSEPVARALAAGVRHVTGAEVGVGITGVAGPDGGTEAKPVGTVFVAVETPEGADCRRLQFVGDRAFIRQLATTAALNMIRIACRAVV